MKRNLMVALAAMAISTLVVPAYAQNNAIYTGGEKGAYNSQFCPPLPKVLENAYFQGYRCTPSAGTVENINNVLKNPQNIGLVQFDVFAKESATRPELANLVAIRSDIACEGLWMVTKNPDLDFGKILGLARRIKFVLPDVGSGSNASFRYLQSLDPNGLGRVSDTNITTVKDATAVINYIANSTQGEVGFFVQFADPTNANIKLMVDKKLRTIPVISRDILRASVNGTQVYQAQSFSLTEGGWISSGMEVTTTCTNVALITGGPDMFTDRNAKDDAKDMIERVRSVRRDSFLPSDSMIASLLKSAKSLSKDALDSAIANVESARKAIAEKP